MKKLLVFITLLTAVSFMAWSGAPNPAKQARKAEKLLSDPAQTAKARELIGAIINDSLYDPIAYDYWVAARVEMEAYKQFYKKLSINRRDPSVDPVLMADALMSAYNYLNRVIDTDTVHDKKGRLKAPYAPQAATWINANAPALYNAGIAYMNKKLYYPQAYRAFKAYATLPDQPYYAPDVPMSDSLRANAYFYAGVMAYNARKFQDAAGAFSHARRYGNTRKEVYLNEMSSLAQIAKADTTLRDTLAYCVTRLAEEGLAHHSIDETPIFLQKYVAGMLTEGRPDLALVAIDTAIVRHPKELNLYALKAGALDAAGDVQGAIDAYSKAASDSTAEYHTLKTAAKYLAQYGIAQLDAVTGRGREARNKSKAIRETYLVPALSWATRALAMKKEPEVADDPELLNIIETVTYRMH